MNQNSVELIDYMGSDKLHLEFLNKLKIKNCAFKEGKLKIISQFKNNKTYIYVEDDFGITYQKPNNLLSNKTPSIKSAIDKQNYFYNQLKSKNKRFFQEKWIIKGVYIDNITKILVSNKYGDCLIRPSDLLNNQIPSIQSAINKTEYFINQAREVHKDKYDYSLVNYVNDRTKVEIICNQHKNFFQEPRHHLDGIKCEKCGRDSTTKYSQENSVGWSWTRWETQGLKSKNFHSFKCYIIKCWNDEEEFYKIGKTFVDIKKRFRNEITMPYKWKVVNIIQDTAEVISKLESSLKKQNKDFKYIPKTNFSGNSECFYKLI